MKIKVMDAEISVQRIGNEDYISLTDMARSQLQEHIIFKWLSNKSTIEYLGEWESLYNPCFNYTEFGTIKNQYTKRTKQNQVLISISKGLKSPPLLKMRQEAIILSFRPSNGFSQQMLRGLSPKQDDMAALLRIEI